MKTPCPDSSVLTALLDSSLPDPVQDEVTAHIDECANCQEKLEELAAGSRVLVAAKSARDRSNPERTSAFWPALARLERERAPSTGTLTATHAEQAIVSSPSLTHELDFAFLDAADDDKFLGRIDRFMIEELIGRGGMGMVFRAFDACLERTVAIKLLDPQYAKNQLARDRFIREARAAARVSHENVVTIHHVECVEEKDLSFLVMQLVHGRSLQDRLDEGGALSIREAVRIAASTAAGLASAHATGLIHRDIKPGNLLIEQNSGRILITDFGLARLTEDVKLTQTGFVAGTPLYMSPEQARGETVDHRSDLFSLGSVLYSLLAGMPPFQGSSPFTVLKQVTDKKPRPIQEVNPAVSNSLVEVLDRLMEKDPRNRFSDAGEVAARLQAELIKLPQDAPTTVTARRTSRSLPRIVRNASRRYGGLALGIGAVLLGGLLFMEAAKVTRWTLLGQRGMPRAMAASESVTTPANEQAIAPRFILPAGDGAVWSVAFDPCEELIATATEGGSVRFWDSNEGHARGALNNQKYKSPVWSIAFNHDGSKLATASDDGAVRLWDVKTKLEVGQELKHPFPVRSVSFSPDGKMLASGMRNGGVIIWDAETGKKIHDTFGHDGGVITSLAFSPDGQLLVSGGSDKSVRIWELGEGSLRASLAGHSGPVYTVAFDPTSRFVASAGWDHTIQLWDANTSVRVNTFDVHKEDVYSLAFCPFGKHLIAGGQDGTAKWIDVETGTVQAVYRGNVGPIHATAVSKDGRRAATGGRDGTVRVWDTGP